MTYARDAKPPFYHGTRADLRVGDLLVAGHKSNYDDRHLSWVYFSGALEAAVWGAELALGSARQRIYIVEPTGEFVDDPNLTDKKLPGNPTASYRSRDALRIVGEVESWEGHSQQQLEAMQLGIENLKLQGKMVIED